MLDLCQNDVHEFACEEPRRVNLVFTITMQFKAVELHVEPSTVVLGRPESDYHPEVDDVDISCLAQKPHDVHCPSKFLLDNYF